MIMMATSSLLYYAAACDTTYEATNIIVNDPTMLFWSTICYYTIVVGSQGYFEYGAPADEIKIYYSVYVHCILTIRMQWRCHHRHRL